MLHGNRALEKIAVVLRLSSNGFCFFPAFPSVSNVTRRRVTARELESAGVHFLKQSAAVLGWRRAVHSRARV